MPASPDHPILRSVEVFPVEENGERAYVVRDPAGFFEEPLLLSSAAVVLLSYCDGEHDDAGIAEAYRTRTGQAISREQVREFIDTLDAAGLFRSESFELRRRELEEGFSQSAWRSARHQGGAYEGDPEELRRQFRTLLSRHPTSSQAGPLRALMAPHIDLHRGSAVYGQSYAALRDRELPEVVVLLGTGHAAREGRYILCDKGFRTPLGDLPVDQEFLGRLEGRLDGDFRRGMLAHRAEHSIEFQALFLAHLSAGRQPPSIVPILCTSFDDCMEAGGRPEDLPEVAAFLAALRETYTEEERRVLVVVGADLSHVGQHFGDENRLDAGFLEAVRETDTAALQAAAEGDASGFFEAVSRERNRYRICSVASIYTTLRLVQPERGEPLGYAQAVDHESQLTVTFAGMAFHAADGPGLRRVDPAP